MNVSLRRTELESWAVNDLGFHGLEIARFSILFLTQALHLQSNRALNIHRLMDEVQYLEGRRSSTCTGEADRFRHEPLKGLLKKHFTDASFIVKNIGAHFGFEHGGNKRLDELIAEAFRENKSRNVDDEFIGRLANGVTFAALRDRAKKRLTGEWIVFQRVEETNYYLTLAAHDEADEEIFARVCQAYECDFPFLWAGGQS